MEKQVKLLMFYLDAPANADGAEQLVDRLYAWEARHVQLQATRGPRGGARLTVTVEVEASDEWRVALNMAKTYGVAHYHRLDSSYHYQPVNRGQRPIVAVRGEQQLGTTVRFGLIGTEAEPLYVRVDDGDVQALCQQVAQSFAVEVPAEEIRTRLEKLLEKETGFVLEL